MTVILNLANKLFARSFISKKIVNSIEKLSNDLYNLNKDKKIYKKNKKITDEENLNKIIKKINKKQKSILKYLNPLNELLKNKKPKLVLKSIKSITEYNSDLNKNKIDAIDKKENLVDTNSYESLLKSYNENLIFSEEIKQKVLMLARDNRIESKTNKNLIIQNPIKQINYENVNGELIIPTREFEKMLGDEYFRFFNLYAPIFAVKFNDIMFNDNNTYRLELKTTYAYTIYESHAWVRSGKNQSYFKNDKKRTLQAGNDANSTIRKIIIGYKALIIMKPNKQVKKETIKDLLAFKPSNNRKYHELCVASTSDNGLCIIETFYHIIGLINLKYRHHNKKNTEEIRQMLKNEGEEIEILVMNGRLVDSLELLTKKYKKEINIVTYGSENENSEFNEDFPININNGVIKILETKKDILSIRNKECFHYEKNKHVAPFVFGFLSNNKVKKLKKKLYKLRPVTLKNNNNKIWGIYGFDFETGQGKDNKAEPLACCIYGENKKNEVVNNEYWGEKCVDNLIDWLEEIRTKKNAKKSRSKTQIGNIFIYGFNNSRFDNLFIFEKINEKFPNAKILFTDNAIKYIKFDNVFLYDMSLIYKNGSLRKTCEAFNLEEEKGVYPYKFLTKQNLGYIGTVPDVTYWNNSFEYMKGCITTYKQKIKLFNLKEYTLKYCSLDAKLVYRLLKIHIDNSTGEINGRKFNVLKCPTSANMAIKIFQQTFLKESIDQSPNDIIIKEKLAYKGGRTEVFKKKFISKDGKCLYYYDINSSYPSCMTKMMPYKYISTTTYDNYLIENIDELVDYNLYSAKSKYIGNNKQVIPNLLIRDDKCGLKSALNTDYSYHWGCELKEAINNNFEIHINEVIEYEGKEIFKEFAEFFYNKRLEIKNTNLALAIFYKNVLNSLYGKFGQKMFEKTVLCNEYDLYKYLSDSATLLTNWEEINDKFLLSYKEKNDETESIGTLVRFSSYITACGKCNLSSMIRNIGHEHIYYCDTDSIFTDKKPNDEFLSNTELGKWKLESEIEEAIFLGKKLYYYKSIEDKVEKKAKGTDASKLKIIDYKNLNEGIIEKKEVSKNMFFRSLINGVTIKEQPRNIKPIYNKRIFEGNNSIAFNNI